MNRISEIEDFLEDLAEELEPDFYDIPKILKNMLDTNQPLSIFSATLFAPKIDSIRAGIFEVAKIEENYSLQILYRSLIEQFIKCQYISMKAMSSSDDTIGIDYWLFGQDQEKIDYVKSVVDSYSMIGIKPKMDPDKFLEEAGVIGSSKSKSLIRKKTDQFRYKNMTRYISDALNSTEDSTFSILKFIFPLYSELSSCVHGGPGSINAYDLTDERVVNIINIATFATLFTKYLTFLHYFQFDNRAKLLCQVTKKYLDKFVKHNLDLRGDVSKDAPPK